MNQEMGLEHEVQELRGGVQILTDSQVLEVSLRVQC